MSFNRKKIWFNSGVTGYQVLYTVPAGIKALLKSVALSPGDSDDTGWSGLLTLNGSAAGSPYNNLFVVSTAIPYVTDLPLSAGETIGLTPVGGGWPAPALLIVEEIPV